MSFLTNVLASPDLEAIAWDEVTSPAVAVIVGDLGTILYSTGQELEEGFQVYTLELASLVGYPRILDVARSTTMFMASCVGGLIATSEDGDAWDVRDISTATNYGYNLYAVAHVTGSIWLAVGGVGNSRILRTTDDGLSWTLITNPGFRENYSIAIDSGNILVVGAQGQALLSIDAGLTWANKSAFTGTQEDLNSIVYASTGFYIVGNDSTILYTVDGTSFATRVSPTVSNYRSITYSGSLWVAVGSNAQTITSLDGTTWLGQQTGIDDAVFTDVGYGDDRFVTLGEDFLLAYSVTGAGRPAFNPFQPISDRYRAQCFAQFGAYMVYGGCMWFEGEEDEDGNITNGLWNPYPRRIMNAAPGSIDDFKSVGWFFTDLPGTGTLLDMTSINSGILIAESDQLSLLTDAGSTQAPWMYHDDYGEGIKPISNLASFNGVGYVVSDDGLIYTAMSVGVSRLESLFDLSQFEDWDASAESVWLQFDPTYQVLFIFRQKAPWTVWLVNDSTGGVTELTLPEVEIDSKAYEPRSAFIIGGLHNGIHAGYARVSGATADLVTVNLDLAGAITGEDEPSAGEVIHHYGDLQTGSFRLQTLGIRGDMNEVMVRTWADPDSTTRPDVAVLIREESDDDWQTDTDPVGSISVGTSDVTGTETTWSRYTHKGVTSGELQIPWLVDQCDIYVEESSVRTPAVYTKTTDFSITLDVELTSGQSLYVNPGPARPFVRGRVGDYIFTEYGAHRITVVNTAYDVELDWYPPEVTTGIYVPAQEMPEGGEWGDGKLIFGLGKGFDQLMLQVLIIPHEGVDATGAKITGLEVGYLPTGKEMKKDSGG
jgi:photosystem II stability/assembly factor-like uncharacterized protein